MLRCNCISVMFGDYFFVFSSLCICCLYCISLLWEIYVCTIQIQRAIFILVLILGD